MFMSTFISTGSIFFTKVMEIKNCNSIHNEIKVRQSCNMCNIQYTSRALNLQVLIKYSFQKWMITNDAYSSKQKIDIINTTITCNGNSQSYKNMYIHIL